MKVLAFGEILFDCYPSAQQIGGAPFNFCAHLARLGGECTLYGAVGCDALGDEALSIAKEYGVQSCYLAKHPTLPTGVCRVTYCGGEPCYDLSGLFAYDEIFLENSLKMITEIDILQSDGIIVTERPAEKDLICDFPGYSRSKDYKYSKTILTIFRKD